jgi:hypothetical protein
MNSPDLWAVKKHARIAELQADHDAIRARMREMEEDAEHATEVMRRVDPDAAPVRISPLSDYRMLVREKAKLLDQIEKSMGQQASDVRSMSMSWVGFVPPSDVRAHAQYLKMKSGGASCLPKPDSAFPSPIPEVDRGTAGTVLGGTRVE